jgi:hypothetical protein
MTALIKSLSLISSTKPVEIFWHRIRKDYRSQALLMESATGRLEFLFPNFMAMSGNFPAFSLSRQYHLGKGLDIN